MRLGKGKQQSPVRVYVFSAGRSVKIGLSNNIKRRLTVAQTFNPNGIKLELLLATDDAAKLEKELHQHFASRHIRLEWFAVTPAQAIKEIKYLIDHDKIDAMIIEYEEEDEIMYHGICKWCRNGFFSTNPRAEFCDNKNHRIYWSKRRSKELLRFWVAACEVMSDFKVREAESTVRFEKEKAEQFARQMGFVYSSANKRWVWKEAV